jgi:hypothetical protein
MFLWVIALAGAVLHGARLCGKHTMWHVTGYSAGAPYSDFLICERGEGDAGMGFARCRGSIISLSCVVG